MGTQTAADCHNDFLIWCRIRQSAQGHDDLAGVVEADGEIDDVLDLYLRIPKQRPPQ